MFGPFCFKIKVCPECSNYRREITNFSGECLCFTLGKEEEHQIHTRRFTQFTKESKLIIAQSYNFLRVIRSASGLEWDGSDDYHVV